MMQFVVHIEMREINETYTQSSIYNDQLSCGVNI